MEGQLLSDNQRELISFHTERLKLAATHAAGATYYPGYDIIVKPSDGKILGMISEDHFIMDHITAYQKIEDALKESKEKAEISGFHLLRNGPRFFTHFRFPERSFNVGNGKPDVLYPEIILRNAYDDSFSFGLEWGVWRQICTNGARMTLFSDKVTRKTLMGDTDVAVMIAQIKDFLDKGLIGLQTRIKEMQRPVEEDFNVKQEMEEILMPHFSNKLQERFQGLLVDASKEEPITPWLLFNTVTNVATHDVHSYNRRRGIETAMARKFHLESYINN